MYAVGDSINLRGVKTAHMSVRQAEVAAANVQAEIEGRTNQRSTSTKSEALLTKAGAIRFTCTRSCGRMKPGMLVRVTFGVGRSWCKRKPG